MTKQTDSPTTAGNGRSDDGPLARAAAAGPLPGDVSGEAGAENAEPATVHDSPAGMDEARAADPEGDADELVGTDPLDTIYGPPPGDRE